METKWYHYIYAFVAGALFINVVPHFVNGVSGTPFPSPFSNPPGIGLSSPTENIIWATINFLIAFSFVYFGKLGRRSKAVIVGYLSGGILMAFYLASYFSNLGAV